MLHQENAMHPYPKRVWVFVQAEVVSENGCEVINHEREQMIGATFDALVAERIFAVLKESQSNSTLLRSNIDPLPSSVLDLICDSTRSNKLPSEDTPDPALENILKFLE